MGHKSAIQSATMTKISIFLFLCIYNLEVLTYNQMKPFSEILTLHGRH